jgi:UDP-3-O-[3-hydroxymyristoyl] glucosamine N-acyltransferase
MADVPPGAKMGGSPARPAREWLRSVAWVDKMMKATAANKTSAGGE